MLSRIFANYFFLLTIINQLAGSFSAYSLQLMHASGSSVAMQVAGQQIRRYVMVEVTLLSRGLTESIVKQ